MPLSEETRTALRERIRELDSHIQAVNDNLVPLMRDRERVQAQIQAQNREKALLQLTKQRILDDLNA